MNESAPPAAAAAKAAGGPDLAELIYVELIGRAFMRVENAASVKPDGATLAKLSLDLAAAYFKEKQASLAALGPKNVGYEMQLDDLAKWDKK
ncbi:MAG: hypothetical protein A3H35_11760 [Betaproteobacteria bacterium RIFCSPLOWO2_02_FULL_62_17]|nr:MAG: hypothetical protein A3H35_11760 [Betaproteobacteria bacterium RIFCSPLOWO2_02_FULL_62_17]